MKNYTTLETVKASDLGDVFIPVSLTKEEFDAQKASGNIYKGFVPKNEITMLKFRYYTPDNILLEQNNVPVVYDGNAVETIINYYKISNESKGIVFNYASYASDGWTTTPQTTTQTIRFLWNVTETIFSNKAKQFTEPTVISVYGQKGDTGTTNENLLHDTKNLTQTYNSSNNHYLVLTNGTLKENDFNGFSSRTLSYSGSSYAELMEWRNFTIPLNSTYTFSFYAKGKHVNCFLYGESGYVPIAKTVIKKNNVVIAERGNVDGFAPIDLTDNWEKYEVTWTNGSSGNASISRRLLFRIRSNQSASVCGVKFEEGDIATAWCPHVDEYKGDTGSQGVRGEKYLGNYTNNDNAYNINKNDLFTGDYYLNSENGLIYVYNEADKSWAEISSYDDYRYSLIIDDMFATIKDLNTNTKYKDFIQAKTAWFENLVANNAFLDNLFSNKIILGNKFNDDNNVDFTKMYIQSKNYEENKAGFRIDAKGQAFFNDLNITGDSTFRGKIDNVIIKAKPFENEIITTERSQGSVIKDEVIEPLTNTKITYNGKQYDKVIVYAGGSNQDYWATLFFFNLNAVYFVISDVFYYTGITAITYPYTMTWKTKLSGCPMELRFENLPETPVSGKIGLVYVENGYLKIVTK